METKRTKGKRNNRGIMLPLAVIMVVILALVGVGLIRLGLNARTQAVKDVLQMSARSAADAGIEEAARYLVNWWNHSSTRSYDAVDALIGEGGISSGVVQLTDTYGEASFVYTIGKRVDLISIADITSTGTAGNVTRTVHAKLGLRSEYDSIGVKNSIDIGVGGGLYTLPPGGEFTIQTNSTESPPGGGVTLRNGLIVPGDVLCGPGGDTDEVIVEKHNVVIEGIADEAPEYMEFFAKSPPAYIRGVDIPIDETDPNILVFAGNGEWVGPLNIGLTAGDPVRLKIDGNNGVDANGQVIPLDIFIDGDIILGSIAELIVTTGSRVNLYLGGSLEAKNGSSITYEKIVGIENPPQADIIEAAKSLKLFGTDTCNSIILKNSGDFYGAIDAPDAYVEIRNSGDLYGAIMGGMDLKIFNSGDFYFVSELYEFLEIETLFMGIIPGSWWEE